jgi:tRNA/rRNA methyltransferase
LVIVNPQCDVHGEAARRMAVHGDDVLAAAQVVSSLPDALVGCTRAIATTARSRALETDMETPEAALPWLIEPVQAGNWNLSAGNLSAGNSSAVKSSDARADELSDASMDSLADSWTDSLTDSRMGSLPEAALIFGPEDRGLSNAELNYAQRFVQIPANADYSSLNLAQAVAVCAYTLYRLRLHQLEKLPFTAAADSSVAMADSAAANIPESPASPASLDAMEGFYQHLESLLLQIGYLHPHTAASRMEKFRRLFYRADLSEPELAMLRGILRQMSWAARPELLSNSEQESSANRANRANRADKSNDKYKDER